MIFIDLFVPSLFQIFQSSYKMCEWLELSKALGGSSIDDVMTKFGEIFDLVDQHEQKRSSCEKRSRLCVEIHKAMKQATKLAQESTNVAVDASMIKGNLIYEMRRAYANYLV